MSLEDRVERVDVVEGAREGARVEALSVNSVDLRNSEGLLVRLNIFVFWS